MRRLKILIWHGCGAYLYYLSQCAHDFYLPSKSERAGDYIGKWGHIPWPDNVHDVPAAEVKNLKLDLVLFQQPRQYLEDRYEILSAWQQRLPKIYLEHDPPLESPTDTRHLVDDPGTLLVHVTPYNDLMWDSRRTPTRVIDHGVLIPRGVQYRGELQKGIVVVNNLGTRARQLGLDVYLRARQEVPLDLIGVGSEEVEGGLGEVKHAQRPAFISHYRFFFNPIRYASLGLAVCEAMMLGMPIMGLATTEMVTAVRNDVSGYVDTDLGKLILRMKELLKSASQAHRLSRGAYRYARQRFNIRRFTKKWEETLEYAAARPAGEPHPVLKEVG